MEGLKSLSIFFPAYNDAATIPSMVISAYLAAQKVTDDFEIIVVNDGSRDDVALLLKELQRLYPQVRTITHSQNQGYGAALRTGFSSASKEWVFYTDGDAQYNPQELLNLVKALESDIDVVNGYKIERSDPLYRIILGRLYHHVVRIAFGFRLRDVDCDYRLIRRSVFDKVQLTSTSGTICLEMVKIMQDLRYRFLEVPIHHYHRAHGRSQFFNVARIFRTVVQLAALWWKLVIRREHLRV